MKLIIAGGRDYQLTPADYALLEELRLSRFVAPIEEVVSGCATGADECGKTWARKHGIPVADFPARWNDLGHPDARIRTRRDGTKYDAEAGPRRNRQMAHYADAVALFPGGDGTDSMLREAKKARLTIYDFRKR